MSGSSCSTLKSGMGGTALGVVLVGLLAVLTLGGFGLTVSPDIAPIVRVVCFAVAAGLAFMTWKVSRRMFPADGRLELVVCEDTVELHGPGSRSQVFGRAEIELIELNEGGFNGVGSFSLYGPGQALLGVWETNWVIKPPQMVMRVLKRHEYPYALTSGLYGNRRFSNGRGVPWATSAPWRFSAAVGA